MTPLIQNIIAVPKLLLKRCEPPLERLKQIVDAGTFVGGKIVRPCNVGLVLAGQSVRVQRLAPPLRPHDAQHNLGSEWPNHESNLCQVQRWTKRWTCFAKQPPGKARQKFLAT